MYIVSNTFVIQSYSDIAYCLCLFLYVVIAMVQHEDIPTFDAMTDFLLYIYPQLKTARTVCLVDGDQANMNSIERKLTNTKLMACLYHISNNVKSYIIPWLKRKMKSRNVGSHSENIEVEDEDSVNDDESEDEDLLEKTEELFHGIQNVSSSNMNSSSSSSSNMNSSSSSSSNMNSSSSSSSNININSLSRNEKHLNEFKAIVKSSRQVKSQVGHAWYPIFDNVRNSPSTEIADIKLDYLISEGLTYAMYLKRIKRTWLKCNYSWEPTFGCQSTQLEEGIFSSLKCLTGREPMYLHQVHTS